ncbi:unnamed protein product [Lactuca virosa]|uniref:FAR1 domain-containing protein n=1 Tax=Lactuca virosa TaxID=75947 RepID=A0AAU9LTG2_9ASTR|nr:unnamed protein product [Lactuca virosa]
MSTEAIPFPTPKQQFNGTQEQDESLSSMASKLSEWGHKSFKCSAIEISESTLSEDTEGDKATTSFNDSAIGTSQSTINENYKGKSTIDKEELYHPNVPADLISKKGQTMSTIDEGIEMYRTYRKAVGFGIRLGSTTTYGDYSLRKKHVRCKRYGQPRKKSIDTLTSIGFDRDYRTNTITVYAFEEAHNHPLTEFNEESLCSHNHRLSISDQEPPNQKELLMTMVF